MSYKVLIAIQARSNNTRLPGKCMEKIGGITVLSRVLYNAEKSAKYLNNGHGDVKVNVCLVTPTNDRLVREYENKVTIYEGPEEDVLTRYKIAMDIEKPDYLVRITSDSPMIPPFIISKHITIATKHGFDYVSNVDERCRTSCDGFDTEVVSRKLFDWADKEAKSDFHREHVTTVIRANPPKWARVATLLDYFDYSQLKLSIDTPEDLAFVRGMHDLIEKKLNYAKDHFDGVFRV